MRRRARIPAALLFLLGAGAASGEGGRVSCTFSNPAYSGVCVETADAPEGKTAKQTCETILACLNDIQCTKTYCRATEIRSGWILVSAEPAESKPGR